MDNTKVRIPDFPVALGTHAVIRTLDSVDTVSAELLSYLCNEFNDEVS